MSVSFVKNPEIRLVVSKKHLPKKDQKNTRNSSHDRPIQFTADEIEILTKIDKLTDLPEPSAESSELQKKSTKRDKVVELTLPQLKQLHAELDESSFICDLIDLSAYELKLPENEIVPRNPQLEERIQRLKAEQEQRRYDDMTRNIDSGKVHHPEDSIAFQREYRVS